MLSADGRLSIIPWGLAYTRLWDNGHLLYLFNIYYKLMAQKHTYNQRTRYLQSNRKMKILIIEIEKRKNI